MNELLLKPSNSFKFDNAGKDRFRLNQIHVEFVQEDGSGRVESEEVDATTAASMPASETPKEIQVSVEFLRFGEIDTMNEKYYAEICIEATWLDDKLPGLAVKLYDPKTRWNPKLYIENALLEPKEEIFYEIKKFYDMIVVKEIRHIKG